MKNSLKWGIHGQLLTLLCMW